MRRIDQGHGLIAKNGGVVGGHAAQNGAGNFGVPRRSAGKLPRLRRKSRALGQSHGIPARAKTKIFYFVRRAAAGIGTGQPRAAPGVFAVLRRKVGDGRSDGFGVRAAPEPQAASQTLVKNMSRRLGDPRAGYAIARFPVAVKVAFMKAIAVDGQSAKQRMKVFRRGFNAASQPRQARAGPSRAHMQHVDVAGPGTVDEAPQPAPPRQNSIEQRQRHGGAFEGKAAVEWFDQVEPPGQRLLIDLGERRVIALKKIFAGPFQMGADAGRGARKSASRESDFPRVDLQQ